MTRTFWRAGGLLLLVLAGGCDRKDADRLQRAGRKLADKVRTVPVGEPPALAGPASLWRVSMGGGPEAGVRARLQLDKGLAEAAVEVQATGPEIRLRGCVRDLTQRRRAVDLAQSTVGVERVLDELEEGPPPR